MRTSPQSLGPRPDQVRRAWIDWTRSLTVAWDWFFVGTFREPYSEEAARRAWTRWLRRVNYAVLGAKKGRVRQVPWLRVIEGPPQRCHRHVHALVAWSSGLDIGRFRDLWVQRHGLATLDHYDPSQDGVAYVLKHVGFGADPLLSPYFRFA